MKHMITVSAIECPRCKETIWSRHGHDFRHCGCGYCFIDGGRHYTRWGYGVGLPDGMQNDGTVPPEVWEDVKRQNEEIGIPELKEIEVEDPMWM